MKKSTPILLVLVTLACSCAILPRYGPEFSKGSKDGKLRAYQEVRDSFCRWTPFAGNSSFEIDRKTAEHKKHLTEQGKSTDYVEGFAWGYKGAYSNALQLYCDDKP